jgi:TonB family protein
MTAIAQALSAALLEFVWQGLLAAFLLWTALMVLRNRPARTRYLASCVALAVMAMLPVVTACLVYTTPTRSQAPTGWAGTARQTMRGAMPDAADGFGWNGGLAGNWSIQIARWALPIWSLGVLLFALRLVWASRQISALRRQAKPAEAAVLSIVGGLQERMKLARPIRVLISAVIDCPSVVGWIRPAVLLPAATVLGLTPQQLEAVLAHELAHILRYDHLVNMLQTVVETLLFYHPAVWWASARIRQERELCCDDLAVAACGDALCYARALTRLERLRVTTPRLALGSAGGPLLYRIQRLAGDAGWQRGPSKLPGILALSLGLICFALNMTWARDQQHDAPVPDEPGVRVDLGGASVIHRDEVEYPEGAIEKRIQGSVVVEVTLDAAGMVSDARVLSGPPELRRAALQSVLQWHFTHDAAGSTRQIRIAFQLPAEGNATPLSAKRTQAMVDALLQKQLAESMAEQARALQSPQADDASELQAEARKSALRPRQMVLLEHELQALQKQATAVTESASELTDIRGDQMAAMEKRLAELQAGLSDSHDAARLVGRRLKIIDIQSVSSAARDELLAKLPVHVGDTLAEDSMERVEATVKQFDEHLGLSVLTTHDGQVEIHITAPGSGDARELRQ